MSTPFRLMFFAVMIGAGLLYGDIAFVRVAGLYFLTSGICMAWVRRVPIGLRGAEPSTYLVGLSAVAFSIGVVLMGVAVVIYAQDIVCLLPKSSCS